MQEMRLRKRHQLEQEILKFERGDSSEVENHPQPTPHGNKTDSAVVENHPQPTNCDVGKGEKIRDEHIPPVKYPTEDMKIEDKNTHIELKKKEQNGEDTRLENKVRLEDIKMEDEV